MPSSAANGATWTNPVKVNVEDADGYVASSNTDTVTLAIATPSGNGAQLLCNGSGVSPPQVAAIAGVATFNNCKIVGPASPPNYTLTATGDTPDGLTPAPASGSITVSPGAPAGLTSPSGMPSTAANGATWSKAVAVNLDDSGGNLTNSTDYVTQAIASASWQWGPAHSATAVASVRSQVAAIAGVATLQQL